VFRIDHTEFGILDPQLLGSSLRHFDHPRREVGGDQPPGVPEQSRGCEPRFTRPGAKLEDGLARLRVESGDHPIRDPLRELAQILAAALPAGGHGLPFHDEHGRAFDRLMMLRRPR